MTAQLLGGVTNAQGRRLDYPLPMQVASDGIARTHDPRIWRSLDHAKTALSAQFSLLIRRSSTRRRELNKPKPLFFERGFDRMSRVGLEPTGPTDEKEVAGRSWALIRTHVLDLTLEGSRTGTDW